MLSTALDNARVMALNDQAGHYKAHGYLDKAEQCFIEALDLAESVDSFDPALLATLRDGLAGLRWEQQRHAEAEALYLEVLSTREQLFSSSHRLVGQSLQTLGNCYLKQGRIGEAARMLERAVQVYREDTPTTWSRSVPAWLRWGWLICSRTTWRRRTRHSANRWVSTRCNSRETNR
ncbi:tetratricopeptide repeat protein [Pseudomonas putida CSV86]|uniref:Tetratricopeptide repeat protein n=1 Tax=Pseudomonas bharatica CSV86 TaxID=1005395 RepID=A0A7K4EBS1_9PSED|nr:tetratricopeptide repeat protein [Pseudomonas bharatica]NNJ15108.1 tetratricopeptide repeat protein [Pseudomonas bharatica CSV86]